MNSVSLTIVRPVSSLSVSLENPSMSSKNEFRSCALLFLAPWFHASTNEREVTFSPLLKVRSPLMVTTKCCESLVSIDRATSLTGVPSAW